MRGGQRTLPSALAPLLSDGPNILLCVLVLSSVPDWMQRVHYIAGGLFILYLAYGAFKSWRGFDANAPQPTSTVDGLPKAALMNMLSPGPYIFWTLVTGPILVAGWRETPMNGAGFLTGFYIAMISTLAAIILVFGTAARLGPKVNRALLGISSIMLFGFGMYQLLQGILYH
jgi:threonine/homoserine/homoserine lactone efflux protein